MDSERRKIMLVDDDNSSRQQGRAILKGKYEVFPLPSAHKLFETLEVFLPDLILLDIRMPVIDGFKTIERLKSNSRFAKIPVIFLTAANDKESVIKGSNLGAAGFVTKPFTARDLVGHIESCLNPLNKSAASDTEEGRAEKPVILIVDDAPDVLKAVYSMLRHEYKVYTLPKPDKLQDLLKSITPDLFLLDYQMPGLSGFELIPLIREYPQHSDTPVIFLTSEGTADNLAAAVELGACDFIVKPIDLDVLHEKLAKHIF